jgi:Thiol:disulfide interchange protein DsbD, N-terminal
VHCSRILGGSAVKLSLLVILLCGGAFGQGSLGQSPGMKKPSVTVAQVPLTTIARGTPGWVSLHFQVEPGFHINSHTPLESYLIPTSIIWDPPTDIVIEGATYPKGELRSFAFAPDSKLSVYTGTFIITAQVHPLSTVAASKYMVHGQLKYQACDNAACYPPKRLPVEFEVKVVKGTARRVRRNPAQSPDIHN